MSRLDPDLLVRAVAVTVVTHPVLRITYEDGVVGDCDLGEAIERNPFMLRLGDPELFEKCAVIHDGRAIGWPGDIDIDAGAQRASLKNRQNAA